MTESPITVKVTITLKNFDFDRSAYNKVLDDSRSEIELSTEEQDNLTPEEMLEYDRRFIVEGDFDLEEFIAGGDYDTENDMKMEIVKDA